MTPRRAQKAADSRALHPGARRRWLALALALPLSLISASTLISGCASGSSIGAASERGAAREQADAGRQGSWTRPTADARIGRYTSSPWGFSTASYWIEGPEGVVLVDTQFLPSATRELIEIAERETQKRVVLAIVLHANPDKFNGTATLQERGVRVITSRQVLELIPEVHEKRVKAFYERYEPDYPERLPEPESFGDRGQRIAAAGLELELHVVGAGCSEAHVLLEFEGHLFAGDLVASGVHSWLEIGETDAWLARVDEMEALSPRYVHPGRGASGGAELLAAQREYLREVIAAVAEERPRGPVDTAALTRVESRLRARYPDHGFPVFLKLGLPAEWRRQAAAAGERESSS